MIFSRSFIKKYLQLFGRKLSLSTECSWFKNDNVNGCKEDVCYCNQFSRGWELNIQKI